MHQFTHFLNHYSQSERLIRIERYVKTIINRGGELPRHWSAQQRLEYCNRTLWHLPKLLSFYEPDHAYSEHINAFWHACEKVGLLECGHLSLMAGQIFHPGMSSVSTIVELESLIAEYANSLDFRRQATDRRYQQQQKQQGLESYTRSLMGRYSRSLVLRVDLGYYKTARVDILMVYRHLDAMLGLVHRRGSMFENATGCVWCVEQGESRGYHIHFSIVLPGHLHQRDGHLANVLGDLWEQVTCGAGTYHSYNAEKRKFELSGTLGIGMIHRDDARACENTVNAIGYLAKPDKEDQFLRMSPVGRRSFGRGMLQQDHLVPMMG